MTNPQLQQEIEQWLYREAALLDNRQWRAWLDLWTDDAEYCVPVPETVEAGRMAESGPTGTMWAAHDNAWMLRLRVDRLHTGMAWAEDPPSRTRHLVSNVCISQSGDDELEVTSYVLLVRNRDRRNDVLSGLRRDRLRRVSGQWKLVRREVDVDQSDLGSRNLGVFF